MKRKHVLLEQRHHMQLKWIARARGMKLQELFDVIVVGWLLKEEWKPCSTETAPTLFVPHPEKTNPMTKKQKTFILDRLSESIPDFDTPQGWWITTRQTAGAILDVLASEHPDDPTSFLYVRLAQEFGLLDFSHNMT